MVSLKSSLKSIGVQIVCFCASFLTFLFQGFRLDLEKVNIVDEYQRALYDAQIMQSNIMLAISGGLLTLFAIITLVFSIVRYINVNESNMGILKALGYSRKRIALSFSKYGINAFIGSFIAFITSLFFNKIFYNEMNSDPLFPKVEITFHLALTLIIIIIPTIIFGVISYIVSYIKLGKNPLEMIKGSIKVKGKKERSGKDFLSTLKKTILHSHTSLIIFVGFAALCFGASVQMSFSMKQLGTSSLFFWLMFSIGLLLGVSILYLAFGFTYNGNKEYMTILKAYGYNNLECIKALYSGYIIVTIIGFIVGTVYQYILLKFMVKVFADVAVLTFTYDYYGLLYTLLILIPVYIMINYYYFIKLKKIPLNEVATKI